jgi:DNA-binding FrmR family transcriptional regulator
MSSLSREELNLLNRTKKVVGQLESVERALNEHAPCADILQRLAAARGAINSLMGELMEDHIRHHMTGKSKNSEDAAADLIEIVRSYLK